MNRAQVELLTRDGCGICHRVYDRLAELSAELGFDLSATDVDAAAAAVSGYRGAFIAGAALMLVGVVLLSVLVSAREARVAGKIPSGRKNRWRPGRAEASVDISKIGYFP